MRDDAGEDQASAITKYRQVQSPSMWPPADSVSRQGSSHITGCMCHIEPDPPITENSISELAILLIAPKLAISEENKRRGVNTSMHRTLSFAMIICWPFLALFRPFSGTSFARQIAVSLELVSVCGLQRLFPLWDFRSFFSVDFWALLSKVLCLSHVAPHKPNVSGDFPQLDVPGDVPGMYVVMSSGKLGVTRYWVSDATPGRKGVSEGWICLTTDGAITNQEAW